ncbi:MAG: DotA/TraY family protein, partial [Desulfosalsimonadaceae bacterium]
MPDAKEAQAQQVENIIESGPTPGAGDKATQMLSELFGDGWTEILWSGQEIQGEPSLIIPILNMFNVIMLAAVSLILLYVVTHAFVGSAHEGTPLGRRLHSIWVPVRSVLSISLLAPIPWAPMLNFIQGVVLVFVGFSIQFANTAMNVGIEYLTTHHGQVIASVPTDLTDAASRAAETGLHNYLIQYHQYWFQENDDLVTGYDKKVREPDNGFLGFGGTNGYWEIDYRFKNPEPFSKDVMGNIVVQCKNPDEGLCRARQSALEDLLANMEEVASRKVEQLYGEDSRPPSEYEVTGMVGGYGETVTEAIKQRIDRENPEFKQELEAFGDTIKEQGFVMLGSYFWAMSRFSMALQDQVGATVSAEDYSEKLLENQVVANFNQIDVSLSSLDSYFRRVEHSREVA